MIEILIVIVIITILATLLLRVVGMVRGRAEVAKETNDVQQLAMAMQAFKDRFGIYPPSRIRLRENTAYLNTDPLDQLSVQYLQRVWPNIQIATAASITNLAEPQCILWCKDDLQKVAAAGSTPGTISTRGNFYELEGDECLVFFLGGIAEFDRNATDPTIRLHGFAKNPRNPGGTPNTNDPASLNRDGPFFDFDASRLFVRNRTANPSQVAAPAPDQPNNANADWGITSIRTVKLPSYRGIRTTTSTPVPIAYFSSYEGRGYRPHDVNYPEEFVADPPAVTEIRFQLPWPTITSDDTGSTAQNPTSLGPNPYTITRSAPIFIDPPPSGGLAPDGKPIDSAGTLLKPYAADTFQIISPGADGKIGVGGKIPPAIPLTSSDPDYDNISNISGGGTVGTFSESQTKGN